MENLVPGFRPLCNIEIEAAPPLSLGPTRFGEVRVVPFVSGIFAGPELRGKVLAGGTDWQEIAGDGTLEIHARYLLESEQGERIEVRSEGIRTGAPDVLAQLAQGAELPASAYYFRTAIRFRTAAPRLARLNDVLAFSIGQRVRAAVQLAVFELL